MGFPGDIGNPGIKGLPGGSFGRGDVGGFGDKGEKGKSKWRVHVPSFNDNNISLNIW